ncbi:unnamed protein product, partial [Laminaria digitata]
MPRHVNTKPHHLRDPHHVNHRVSQTPPLTHSASVLRSAVPLEATVFELGWAQHLSRIARGCSRQGQAWPVGLPAPFNDRSRGMKPFDDRSREAGPFNDRSRGMESFKGDGIVQGRWNRSTIVSWRWNRSTIVQGRWNRSTIVQGTWNRSTIVQGRWSRS